MITLNNSNIDFGFEDETLGSKYSILLSQNTSNFIFKTDDVERMTIMKNGKVGIGTFGGVYDLDVNGSINTGVYLINGVDISTSTITGDTSNYLKYASNILIGRIRDTSNYVKITSNILVGPINYTSNYILNTSNILVGLINYTSNYVKITSNILIGPIIDTSNYVISTSNILIGSINDTSNYFASIASITSNYIENSRNNLVSFINSELSSKSQWIYNNHNICYYAGNVGIGTTNPVSKLNLYSDISSILTLENNQPPFIISPNTVYTESTTIENGINYKNLIFTSSSNYPQITNNKYSPYYAENPSGTTSNLIAWYKFDGDALDSSRRLKHLSVINGNPTYSTDFFQGRRYVNTYSGSFKCNLDSSFGGTSFSISVWIKSTTTTAAFFIHHGVINNIAINTRLIIGYRTNISYTLSFSGNEIPASPVTNSGDLGLWVHVVYVVTTSGRKIYRNGDLISTDTNTSLLNTSKESSFYIGSSYIGTTEASLGNININISDLRIYSIALNNNQVSELYNINIINFRIPSATININGGIDNNVTGRYIITRSSGNSLMVPLDGQNVLDLPSTPISTLTIKYLTGSGEILGDPPTMIGTTSEYKYMIYTYTKDSVYGTGQTTYNIYFPSDINCDILMVGGGGSGGSWIGPTADTGYAYAYGGGGGGAVFYGKNVNIKAGSYLVDIGRGAIFSESRGKSTKGFGATILGGQSANYVNDVNNGASGAGSPTILSSPAPGVNVNGGNGGINSTSPASVNIYTNANSSTFLFKGNRGGKNTEFMIGREFYQSGGGGGAGTPAKPSYYNSGGAEVDGGDGILVDILGVDLYWGGGGGGSGYNGVSGKGGLGGGGSGSRNPKPAIYDETDGIAIGISYEGQNSFYRPSKPTERDAGPHTGGGGGGAINSLETAGNGGSGIIIIRILSNSSSSYIQLANNTANYDNIEYKIGNYNNIFKIISFKNGINTDNLIIDNNGNIGIGTLQPSYRLEVSECLATTKLGAIESGLRNNYIGLSNNIINIQEFSNYSIVNICAKFNGSIWITGECLFAINSDMRIKEDIQDINVNSALQMILAVELKTYKYIDKIENGDRKVYGFIAQQVQQIIPEAISLENTYIPNIMMLANYNKKIITLPYKPSKVEIKIKDKIKCYDSNNVSIEIEVLEIINDLSFKIKDFEKEYINNKIFVYGTFVNDFYTLSKEYIFTLNIGATHELYRCVKVQGDIIKSREEEINALEQKNRDLNKKYERLLKEITLIKQRINS